VINPRERERERESRMNRSQSSVRSYVIVVLVVVLVGGGALFFFGGDARRAIEMRAVEVVGEVVTARMASADGGDRAADFINIPIEVRKIGDFIYQARGVANTHLISTDEGNILFDSGLSIQAPKQKRLLEDAAPARPLTHLIVSHSHADHSGGVKFWAEEGTEIVAHEEFEEEQRYQEELQPYLWFRNRTLFPFMPEEPPTIDLLAFGGIAPTRIVGNREPYLLEQGGVRMEIIGAPGAEGSDNLILWLPDEKILLSGDFFGPLFPQFPNVFTMRGEKIRKPIEYIKSLNRIIALGPEIIVPSHRDPISGRDQIRADLIRMRDAVQYVHDATIQGMNDGKTVHQLMAEVTLPPHLELSQAHGRVSWAVKSIWEYYTTWFHFDSTTELYPVPASSVYRDLVELAGVDGLLASAQAHLDAGRPVQALYLIDVVTGSDDASVDGLRARRSALVQLLEAAEAGLRNSYEVDWLSYRIRSTDARLSELSGA
jgi:alkyl sulfatase BDS1-like metallo-beta-lactamase superfamily hydrolase